MVKKETTKKDLLEGSKRIRKVMLSFDKKIKNKNLTKAEINKFETALRKIGRILRPKIKFKL